MEVAEMVEVVKTAVLKDIIRGKGGRPSGLEAIVSILDQESRMVS